MHTNTHPVQIDDFGRHLLESYVDVRIGFIRATRECNQDPKKALMEALGIDEQASERLIAEADNLDVDDETDA